MKSFKNYIIEELLQEANYDEMFSQFKDAERIYKWSKDQIDWAKKTLKKQDRIIWFLRIVKLFAKSLYYSTGGPRDKKQSPRISATDATKEDVDDLVKKGGRNEGREYYEKVVRGGDSQDAQTILLLRMHLKDALEEKNPAVESIVFKYQPPEYLLSELKKAAGTLSKSQKKSKILSKEVIESHGGKLVFENDDWAVVIPEDHKASCYFGLGTPWCVSVKSNTTFFDQYTERGPLYIILSKKERDSKTNQPVKYGFIFHKNEFKDANNNQVAERSDIFKWIEENLGKDVEEFFESKNPSLAALIKKYGADSEQARNYALDILREFGKSKYPFSIAHPYFILEQYDDIDDLIKHSMLDNKHLTALLKDGMDDKIQDVIMEFIPHSKQLMNDLSYYIPRELEEKLMNLLKVEDSDELYKQLSEDDELMDRIRSDYEEDLSDDLFNTNVKNIYSYIESCTNDASIEQVEKKNQYGHNLRAPIRVIYKDPKTNKYETITENSPTEILFNDVEVFLSIDTKAAQFTEFMAEVEASPNYEPDTSNPTSQLLEDIIQWDNPGFAMIEEPLVSRAFQEKRKKSTIWQLQEYLRKHSK